MRSLLDICHDALLKKKETNRVKSIFYLPLDLIVENRLKEAHLLCGNKAKEIILKEISKEITRPLLAYKVKGHITSVYHLKYFRYSTD